MTKLTARDTDDVPAGGLTADDAHGDRSDGQEPPRTSPMRHPLGDMPLIGALHVPLTITFAARAWV